MHPSLPAKNTRDPTALAKAQPGNLVFASSGAGTSARMAMEMFSNMTKTELLHVPDRGGGAAVVAVMGSEAQAGI